jgi:hypothetical protein
MEASLKLGNGDWGVKNDSLLAYDDFGGKFRPLPFDFTRASSATVVNKQGLIETVQSGIPRIDFSDDANGALKLEPQRTNRIPNSEDGSTWAFANLTLSSLSGGLNKEYYQITSLGNTGRFDVVQNNWVNLTAGTYTASVFAKKGTSDQIILTTRANFSSQSAYSVFNLTSGTVVSNNGVTGSIEPYSDGWYRCAITFTNSGSYTDFASFAFGFDFNSSSTDTLFVASPQSEIGSYATSYIPTQGAISTRLAETCSGGGDVNTFNSSEGVLGIEMVFNYVNTNNRITIGDGTNSNYLFLDFTTKTNLRYIYRVNNSTQMDVNVTLDDLTINSKLAVTWKDQEYKVYQNGNLKASGVIPVVAANKFTTLNFSHYNGILNFYGNTKDVRVYKTALSDSELISLTSL